MNLQEFEKRIADSEKPVVVDFWATWCAPCRTTKPILDKLGREYAESALFLPVNADQAREVMEKYRIFGIPTVIAFKDGKEAARIVGARNEDGYRVMFEALAKNEEIKFPLSQGERVFRLGAGALLVVYGANHNIPLVTGIGVVLIFFGLYDRCPLVNALTGFFRRKRN
ncbi:MAG: thioredoxin [Anaerolineales bacterium]|nr:thioredoxin [Anaerolineales bacterium]